MPCGELFQRGQTMTDQISFLPMLEPRDTTFEDNERIAEQICTEEWQKAHGNTGKG